MWKLKLLGVLAVFLAALWFGRGLIPSQHNPFSPLDLTAPRGAASTAKLKSLKYDRAQCFDALARAHIGFEVLPPSEEDSCALDTTLILKSASDISYRSGQPLRLTCYKLATLMAWQEQIVRPAARKYLDRELVHIETMGSFSCRNIAGGNKRSQHAFAKAIDISGFVFADETRITVLDDWKSQDDDGANTPEARFLRAVHKGACGLFSVTLGPDYNAAHANHFHLDTGPDRVCS